MNFLKFLINSLLILSFISCGRIINVNIRAYNNVNVKGFTLGLYNENLNKVLNIPINSEKKFNIIIPNGYKFFSYCRIGEYSVIFNPTFDEINDSLIKNIEIFFYNPKIIGFKNNIYTITKDKNVFAYYVTFTKFNKRFTVVSKNENIDIKSPKTVSTLEEIINNINNVNVIIDDDYDGNRISNDVKCGYLVQNYIDKRIIWLYQN